MDERKDFMFSRKDLQRLIIPLIVEQFLSITIGMADTVMVSVCGEAAVSGVSLVDAINILMINIFSALATGGAIVSSQYIGREDLGKACEAAKQLVLLSLSCPPPSEPSLSLAARRFWDCSTTTLRPTLWPARNLTFS